MLKSGKKLILFVLITGISTILMAGETTTVKGALGNKGRLGLSYVICELGSQKCVPVTFDEDLKVNVDGKLISIENCKEGWYIEATFKQDADGKTTVEVNRIDPGKTVFCFPELTVESAGQVKQLLNNTPGVKTVREYKSSSQIFVDFDTSRISYLQLREKLTEAGFQLGKTAL